VNIYGHGHANVQSVNGWGDSLPKDGGSRITTFFPAKNNITAYQMLDWLVVSTPLKNMKVSWEYDIPNMEFQKNNVPNHQPVDLDISPGTNMQSYTVPMANKSCDSSYLYGKAVADC